MISPASFFNDWKSLAGESLPVFILAQDQCAGMTALLQMHRSDAIPHQPIKAAKDQNPKKAKEKMPERDLRGIRMLKQR